MSASLFSCINIKLFSRLLFTFCLCVFSYPAPAFNSYLQTFNANYGTDATRLNTCGVCHYDFNGGGPRTPYGEDFLNNGLSVSAIGSLDSDGDGFTNDAEANAATLTHPGYNCVNVTNTVNAPADLADYVNPALPGCIGSGLPPLPEANGPYVQVRGQPITLSSAGSSDPDGTIVSYLWNLGVLGTSSEPNPTVTYDLGFQAMIIVSLTVTDNDGNTATDTATVYSLNTLNLPPVANAGAAAAATVNVPAAFNGNASADPEGSALQYFWDFGDGATGSGVMPSHAYARCGTYNVSLTVSDDYGLTGSASTTAVIASSGITPPVANAGGGVAAHYDGTLGSNVQFDGSLSTDADCDIVDYSWDFGDGAFGTGVNPVHSYAAAGDYVVSLVVTDNDGLASLASSATVSIIDTGPPDGAALYDSLCGDCHGFGANSAKAGATVQRINNGITSVAAMASLSNLSTAEIQAISDFLVSLLPPGGGTPDGATLYASNCAGCHGADSNSTKIGATVARIDNGIANVTDMNYLSSVLSAADIQAISDYLVSLNTGGGGGSDGASLWGTYCSSCHGADASAKAGATVGRINTGITAVTDMNFLSGVLTTADIQALADYLGSLAAPTTPYGLYTAYCASCHGADGSGGTSNENVVGASRRDIRDAIEKESEMQSLSFLTYDETQLISDFLNGDRQPPAGGGGTGGSDGASLWGSYCAGCHGNDASAKAGATVSRINAGISSVSSMNFLSGVLTSTDIQTLADYLGSLAPPTTPYGLYTAYCASCHGADGSGGTSNENVVGASRRDIRDAIEKESEMQSLSFLTYDETQLISDFLNGDRQPPAGSGGSGGGGTVTGGQQLYESNCAGCHGYGDLSEKIGATVSRINNGITSVSQMNYLAPLLSSSDIQAISDYLVSLGSTGGGGGTADGAGLWGTYCSGCHGDANAKAGATVSRINAGISSVSGMNYLSGILTATDIQTLADYLGSLAPPSTPEGLYVSYCAACHGTDARGGTSGENVRGESVRGIKSAIQDEQDMRYLSFLTDEQIIAISNYLGSFTQSYSWSWSSSWNNDD